MSAARAALRAGASGIVAWPEESAVLRDRLLDATASRVDNDANASNGLVISVSGARGGCGATSIVAHLGRVFGRDATIVDLCGGQAGQLLYAPSEPPVLLSEALIADPSPESLRRISSGHASGAACVYATQGLHATNASFTASLRRLSRIVVVDGWVPRADVCVLVVSPDVGAVRAAVPHAFGASDTEGALDGERGATVVLSAARRGRIGPRDVKRALGALPFVVPHDRRIARAGDLGRVASRGAAVRAIAKLAKELAP